ncbi:MAG: prephenate dehydrogenase/arogenate dehydrogenase family protein, partial [Rickettsiales bacterium]|nr:prephenate dehydrogenase/arogenate dehydrogenase family protein [Rickettsiales bacterium]
ARAFRKTLPGAFITAVSSDKTINRGLELGIIDAGFSSIEPDSVKDADLVIICTPLSTYEELVGQLVKHSGKHTIITDIGSVKGYVAQDIRKLIPTELQPNFVPAHPIAGSEKSGVEHGDADIFRQKVTYITPTDHSSADALAYIEHMWHLFGAIPKTVSATKHDQLYSKVSHLVQLLISCYAHTEEKADQTYMSRVDDSPLFDRFFRLSSSNPDMWIDIITYNRGNIVSDLGLFIERLESIIEQVKQKKLDDVASFVRQSCHKRAQESSLIATDAETKNSNFIIPLFMVSCLLSIVSEDELQYSGSGFRDVTELAILSHHIDDLIVGFEPESLYDLFSYVCNELVNLKMHFEKKDRGYVYALLS